MQAAGWLGGGVDPFLRPTGKTLARLRSDYYITGFICYLLYNTNMWDSLIQNISK